MSKVISEKLPDTAAKKTESTAPENKNTSNLPFISVILPVRNEENFIAATMRQIAAQDYPKDRYELLLIDGISTDRTVQIAQSMHRQFANFRVLTNKKQLSSSARNIGFRAARGDYLIVIDGHIYIENKSLFRDMVQIFEQTGLDVLSRPQPLTPPDNNFFQNAVAFARESSIGHGMDSTIYNREYSGPVNPASSGAMYRRSIVEKVGYFDESFDAAEDYEYNFRIAQCECGSYITPCLTVYYYPRDNLRGLYKQMHRYGLGRNKMLKKHGVGLSSGALIPPLFFLSILVMAILSIFIEKLWILPSMMAGVYLLAVCIGSLVVAFNRGLKYLPLLPMIFITIHIGLAAGMISGFFRHSPRNNDLKKQI